MFRSKAKKKEKEERERKEREDLERREQEAKDRAQREREEQQRLLEIRQRQRDEDMRRANKDAFGGPAAAAPPFGGAGFAPPRPSDGPPPHLQQLGSPVYALGHPPPPQSLNGMASPPPTAGYASPRPAGAPPAGVPRPMMPPPSHIINEMRNSTMSSASGKNSPLYGARAPPPGQSQFQQIVAPPAQINGGQVPSAAPNPPAGSKLAAPPVRKPPSYPWQVRQLQQQTPFPRCDYSLCAVRDGAEMWLFGGLGRTGPRNDLFSIQTATLTGQALSAEVDERHQEFTVKPAQRDGHTSIATSRYLLVFGGECDDGKCEDALYVMTIEDRLWRRVTITANPPVGRRDHAAVLVGELMYIFGGQTDGYFLHDLVAFDVRTLDTPSPRWDYLEPANEGPSGRAGHTASVHYDRIYVFGGTDGESFFNEMWCYDLHNNTWELIVASGHTPPGRAGHAACIVDDCIYVTGGKAANGKNLSDVIAFRIRSRRWYTFQNMGPAPSARSGHSMIAFGTRIYVLNGEAREGEDPTQVNILDTSKIKYPNDPPLKPRDGPPPTPSELNARMAAAAGKVVVPPEAPIQPIKRVMSPLAASFPELPPLQDFSEVQIDPSLLLSTVKAQEMLAEKPPKQTFSVPPPEQPPAPSLVAPPPSPTPPRPNLIVRIPYDDTGMGSESMFDSPQFPQLAIAPDSMLSPRKAPEPPSSIKSQPGKDEVYDKPTTEQQASPALDRPSQLQQLPTLLPHMGDLFEDSSEMRDDLSLPPPTPVAKDNRPPRLASPPRLISAEMSMNEDDLARDFLTGAPLVHGATQEASVTSQDSAVLVRGKSQPLQPPSFAPSNRSPLGESAIESEIETVAVEPPQQSASERNSLEYALQNRSDVPVFSEEKEQLDNPLVEMDSIALIDKMQELHVAAAGIPSSPPAPDYHDDLQQSMLDNEQHQRSIVLDDHAEALPQSGTGHVHRIEPLRLDVDIDEADISAQSAMDFDQSLLHSEPLPSHVADAALADETIIDTNGHMDHSHQSSLTESELAYIKAAEESTRSLVHGSSLDRGTNTPSPIAEPASVPGDKSQSPVKVERSDAAIIAEKQELLQVIMQLSESLVETKGIVQECTRVATEKVAAAERSRQGALQEAAYLKARMAAVASGDNRELARIGEQRTLSLEAKLSAVVAENHRLREEVIEKQEDADQAHEARIKIERMAVEAENRAVELELLHVSAQEQIESLNERLSAAETAAINSTRRSLPSDTEESNTLGRRQTENQRKAVESASVSARKANDRATQAEMMWQSAQDLIAELERAQSGLRAEAQTRQFELERAQTRIKDLESLWQSAREQATELQEVNDSLMQQHAVMEDRLVELQKPGDSPAELRERIRAEQEVRGRMEHALRQADADRREVLRRAQDAERLWAGAQKDLTALKRRSLAKHDQTAYLQQQMKRTEEQLRRKERECDEAQVRVQTLLALLGDDGSPGLAPGVGKRVSMDMGAIVERVAFLERDREDMERAILELSTELERYQTMEQAGGGRYG